MLNKEITFKIAVLKAAVSVFSRRSAARDLHTDRSFTVSGPSVWNSLPAALRLDMSLSVFRARLKTFFMTYR